MGLNKFKLDIGDLEKIVLEIEELQNISEFPGNARAQFWVFPIRPLVLLHELGGVMAVRLGRRRLAP